MALDLTTFDTAQLVRDLKIRIQAACIASIPDDKLSKMVDEEVKAFFSTSSHETRYTSRFREVVFEALKVETNKKLGEYFNSPEWTGKWSTSIDGSCAETASDAVKKIVLENVGAIILAAVSQPIQSVVSSLRNIGRF